MTPHVIDPARPAARPDPRPADPAPHARASGAWRIVAAREVVARITDRNFLISTGLTLAVLVVVLGLQAFLATQTSTSTVATSDAAGARIAQAAASGHGDAAGDSRDILQARAYPDAASAKQAVLDGAADAWLHREGGAWVLSGHEDAPDGGLQASVAAAVRQAVLDENARAAGTSAAALEKGATLTSNALAPTVDPAGQGARTGVGFFFAFLFYFASVMFGMAIASSVVEEKQSRIIEILATVIPVRQLLAGKVIGNTALALGQMVLFVGVGLVGLSFTPLRFVVPSLVGASAWFLVFFVVGFLALACVWATAGALASRSEDLQATTTPLTMTVMTVFFLALYAKGTWQVVASYVPIASSITMPTRVLDGTAQWWEPFVALVVTLAFAALMVLVGERIYRRALLQTQGRLTVRQALRTAE